MRLQELHQDLQEQTHETSKTYNSRINWTKGRIGTLEKVLSIKNLKKRLPQRMVDQIGSDVVGIRWHGGKRDLFKEGYISQPLANILSKTPEKVKLVSKEVYEQTFDDSNPQANIGNKRWSLAKETQNRDYKALSVEEAKDVATKGAETHKRFANQVKKLEQALSSLRTEQKMLEEEKNSKLRGLSSQIGALENILPLGNMTPTVSKGSSSQTEGSEYSLWLGDSPVVLYTNGGTLGYIGTNSKDSEFKLKGLNESRMSPEARSLLETVGGLEAGRFYTLEGFRLTREQEQIAKDLFGKVMEGKQILPCTEGEGFKDRSEKGRIQNPEQYRTWGQEFLEGLIPDEITQGKLQGSGGSYRAFHFGDKTVVEFDHENHATYLIDREQFDRLRKLDRGTIIREQPTGYKGRIIHTEEERNTWETQVIQYLQAEEQVQIQEEH